jgi:hypothetical protein
VFFQFLEFITKIKAKKVKASMGTIKGEEDIFVGNRGI